MEMTQLVKIKRQIEALNARVDDYEKRRVVFQKEAGAFDTGLWEAKKGVPRYHAGM